MNKKTKKTILISTSIFALGASLFAAFGSNFDLGNVLSARASGTYTDKIITFSTSDGQVSSTSVGKTAITQSDIYCKGSNNDPSITTSDVSAAVNGTVLKFYESDGVTEYTFESLTKITFYNPNKSKFSYRLDFVYDDGVAEYLTYGEQASPGTTRSANFATLGKRVANLTVTFTTTTGPVFHVNQIDLQYSCTPKQQTGVSVSQMPYKTTYGVGQSFNPYGMIVNADYSTGTNVATKSYTYYPAGPLSLDDTEITISHRGFTTTIPITVIEGTPSEPTFGGSYSFSPSGAATFALTLTSNSTTGTYARTKGGTSSLDLTYTLYEYSFTIKFKQFASGTSMSNFTSWRPFLPKTSSTWEDNATGRIIDYDTIRITLYDGSNNGTEYTLTRN